jgi:ATP-dependent DNA helicase DinG
MIHTALVAGHARAALLTQDGEILTLETARVLETLRTQPAPLVVHLPATARRLGVGGFPALDLLELFAFVLPARTAAPTPRGLAQFLELRAPEYLEAEVSLLPDIADALLDRLATLAPTPSGGEALALALRMQEAGWPWADACLAVLARARRTIPPAEALSVWRRLAAWEERPLRPAPASHPVEPQASRHRLARLLGPDAEQRAGQADYAHAASAAFAPRAQRGDPILMLAEAGTGTGKTLGYVAPASLWAERNAGPVWISTYTRHLQRQIERELERLHPDRDERRQRVVIRKGRENYLCLLNFEDIVRTTASRPNPALVPLGLIARWATATDDGDLQGGDLPGWLRELFGQNVLTALADRRGECIHGACAHYSKCFVEHTIRRARDADLVVANHALVMVQAAFAKGGGTDGAGNDRPPTRYVFDEGHQIADAADSAFAVALSGLEAAELRRWLLGAEGARSRARGLRRRLDDLVTDNDRLTAPMEAALLAAATALPPPGWSVRLAGEPGEASEPTGPGNPMLQFLIALRRQILARTEGNLRPGNLECDLHPISPETAETATTLARALDRIRTPLITLADRLAERLDEDADALDATTRGRIEAMVGVIRRRAIMRLEAWSDMLRAAAEPPATDPGDRPNHVMFARLDPLDRAQGAGQIRDVALCRHWLDPTLPFVLTLAAEAHGLLVTSATLRDESERDGIDADLVWRSAEARVGADHLPSPAIRASLPSPFDYATQTRCFVVTDLPLNDIASLAAAYRTLFLAAGGGALGLFTAITRLRAVHDRIKAPLDEAGIPLLAQHVDAMDNATLVDIFRAEANSCLLGTDAMRDGVDVPGDALRLVVFERVPWMRPDILHRERRLHLSGGDPAGYDDRIARLRLRQAFGRLIRTTTDRGCFVLLDRRTPTRLFSAFPPGVPIERVGLSDAIARTREFLRPGAGCGLA